MFTKTTNLYVLLNSLCSDACTCYMQPYLDKLRRLYAAAHVKGAINNARYPSNLWVLSSIGQKMVEWNQLDVSSFLDLVTGFLTEHGQLDGLSCQPPAAKRARSVNLSLIITLLQWLSSTRTQPRKWGFLSSWKKKIKSAHHWGGG